MATEGPRFRIAVGGAPIMEMPWILVRILNSLFSRVVHYESGHFRAMLLWIRQAR